MLNVQKRQHLDRSLVKSKVQIADIMEEREGKIKSEKGQRMGK